MDQNKLNGKFVDEAADGRTDTVKLLLEHGADVHVLDNQALRWAALRGRTDTVKLLLEHGADIHAVNDYALRWTSANGYTDTVKLLLEHGADVHALNDEALQWAASRGHTDTVKLLLEHGADLQVLMNCNIDKNILFEKFPFIKDLQQNKQQREHMKNKTTIQRIENDLISMRHIVEEAKAINKNIDELARIAKIISERYDVMISSLADLSEQCCCDDVVEETSLKIRNIADRIKEILNECS